MRTLYLIEPEWQLVKHSRHLTVMRNGKVCEEIPMHNLRRIIVFGNSRLSTNLLHYLARNGIEVAFLSIYGRFRFRLLPEKSKNIFLRLAQYEKYHNVEFRLALSRGLIKAKICNQRSLLLRYRRNQPETELTETIFSLQSAINRVEKADSIKKLMGIEGSATRLYFTAFNLLLKGGFTIKGRSYHPPEDPVNSMLSFGYMLVFNELNALLDSFGFDSLLGFLHSPKYGRASLAADLIEQFRAPMAERLVLYLVNKKIIKKDCFSAEGEHGIVLNQDARKKFLENYEKFVTDYFRYPVSGMRKNFRGLFRDAVMNLEKSILDKQAYQPFIYYS